MLKAQWSRHRSTLLLVAAAYMLIAAVGRLKYAFPYLVSDVEPWAALDLKKRHIEVQSWFAGSPLYGVVENADYPPASYAMLWPLFGWLEVTPARWLFAATTVIVIGMVSYLIVQESGAHTRAQRVFAGLLIFSTYPTQMIVFVGQLGLHVLVLLVGGFVWLHRGSGRWTEDLVASVLLVLALVKPTLSAPFFWIVLFTPGRVRPFTLVVMVYVALTLLAAAFQQSDLVTLLQGWLSQTRSQVTVMEGFSNVHKWLALAGQEALMMTASFVMLAALGVWTFLHRKVDVWILVGVAALVARFWVHHRLHDDILVLLPMIALLRLAWGGSNPDRRNVIAGVFLAATWATMHIPTWAFYSFSRSYVVLLEMLQSIVWVAVLVFLVIHARTSRT